MANAAASTRLALRGDLLDFTAEPAWGEVDSTAVRYRPDHWLLIDDGRAGASYSVVTLPHSVLVDPEGLVAGTFDGAVTKSGVEEAVRSILKATPNC